MLLFWPDCAALVVHASFGYYFFTTLHLPVCLCLVFGILEQGVLINSWFQIAYINVDIFMAIIVRCLPILIYRLKSFSYKPRLPHFDWGAKEK